MGFEPMPICVLLTNYELSCHDSGFVEIHVCSTLAILEGEEDNPDKQEMYHTGRTHKTFNIQTR